VYDLGNGYVVKVARNKRGIAQNKVEHHIASKSNSALFAKVPQVSSNYHLLIMEKADRIKNMSEVWKHFDVQNNRQLFRLKELKDIPSKYGLLLPDLCRPVNWGKTDRGPVIIDYGFTWRVRNNYYLF
jgi:hypothetical protein